jgi:hypothetical protein
MARTTYDGSKFSRKVELNNPDGTRRPGEFWLIRKAQKQSRVISVDNLAGSGELVDSTLIVREWEYKPEAPPAATAPVPVPTQVTVPAVNPVPPTVDAEVTTVETPESSAPVENPVPESAEAVSV